MKKQSQNKTNISDIQAFKKLDKEIHEIEININKLKSELKETLRLKKEMEKKFPYLVNV